MALPAEVTNQQGQKWCVFVTQACHGNMVSTAKVAREQAI